MNFENIYPLNSFPFHPLNLPSVLNKLWDYFLLFIFPFLLLPISSQVWATQIVLGLWPVLEYSQPTMGDSPSSRTHDNSFSASSGITYLPSCLLCWDFVQLELVQGLFLFFQSLWVHICICLTSTTTPSSNNLSNYSTTKIPKPWVRYKCLNLG